jgi:predicted nucleic acid-binding protein
MGALDRFRGQIVYLDANIIIYIVEGFPLFRAVLEEIIIALDTGLFEAVTSELTLAEVLVQPFRTRDSVYETTYTTMLSGREALRVVPVEREMLIEAARIRAEHNTRLADAIHVATAQASGCSIFLTNDDRLRAPAEITILTLAELAAS